MLRTLAKWKQTGSKALFALVVGGSVLMVGYLPNTITQSPGADPEPAQATHAPGTVDPLLSEDREFGLLEDCRACHDTTGPTMTTKPFPSIPHRIEGWSRCSFCHAQRRLAPAPPKHEGLPDAFCQACHRPSATQPPSLGHVLWQDQTCSSCHGTSLALPISHEDRGDQTCVVCHEQAEVAPPAAPHRLREDGLCSSCHTRELMSAVPRHAQWSDETQCLTCHTSEPTVPKVPHAMEPRSDCSFCHVEQSARHGPGLAVD